MTTLPETSRLVTTRNRGPWHSRPGRNAATKVVRMDVLAFRIMQKFEPPALFLIGIIFCQKICCHYLPPSISYSNQGPLPYQLLPGLELNHPSVLVGKPPRPTATGGSFRLDTKRDGQSFLDLDSTWQFEIRGVILVFTQCNINSHDLG